VAAAAQINFIFVSSGNERNLKQRVCSISYTGHKSSANSVRSKSRKTITEHTMPSMISNKVSPSGSSLIAQRTGPVTRMDSDGLRGTALVPVQGEEPIHPIGWFWRIHATTGVHSPPALQPPARLKPTPSGWLHARGAEAVHTSPSVSPTLSPLFLCPTSTALPLSRRRAQTSISHNSSVV
jgi:hypothetical protein